MTAVCGFDQFSGLHRFSAQRMNAAIYQFKALENASLHYADEEGTERTTSGWACGTRQ